MIYAIGDIHGCIKTLKALMAKLPYTPDDLLVFMGDYIDRGPDSKAVVDYLLDLSQHHDKLVLLRGNHEQMALDAMRAAEGRTDLDWYLAPNGAKATLKSYGGALHPAHAFMFQSLLLCYETDDYFFCHAGVDANFPLHKQPKETLLWMREPFIHSTLDYGKKIVFGHTQLEEVLITPNKIGIDTGCVKGRKLSAIQLPTEQVFSVDCLDLG